MIFMFLNCCLRAELHNECQNPLGIIFNKCLLSLIFMRFILACDVKELEDKQQTAWCVCRGLSSFFIRFCIEGRKVHNSFVGRQVKVTLSVVSCIAVSPDDVTIVTSNFWHYIVSDRWRVRPGLDWILWQLASIKQSMYVCLVVDQDDILDISIFTTLHFNVISGQV